MATSDSTDLTRINFSARDRSAPNGYLTEIGYTGLEHGGGYITEEFLSELTGWRWRRIVKEMLTNDDVVHVMFFLIDVLARGVEWKVVTKGKDNDSLKRAEFITSCMDDMSASWRDTIADIFSYLPWGFSYHEVCYKIRNGETPLNLVLQNGIWQVPDGPQEDVSPSKFKDGLIGWRKVPIRSQDSLNHWDLDKHGGIQAFNQFTVDGPATIPIDKALLFRTTAHKNNPEGRSLCRRIYRSWYFKQRIQNIEGIGIERDLAGLPVGYIPVEYMKDDADPVHKQIYGDFKKLITSIKRDEDEGIVCPSDLWPDTQERMFEIKLLASGGTRQFDTSKIIQRYDQRILMTLMADFLLLGHEKVGSFALASSKTEMFSLALGAFLDIIKDIFNRHAIPKLLKLNGMPTDNQPEIDHGDVETIDLGEIADFVSKVSGTKVYLDDDQQRWILKQAGLPVVDDKPMPKPPAPPALTTPGAGSLPPGEAGASGANPDAANQQ